jgi:hypothetical protein
VCLSILAGWNKALAQLLSKREFNFWMILPGTESRAATFHAETRLMFHQFLRRQATKRESPVIVVLGSKRPKSDHGSCENVFVNSLITIFIVIFQLLNNSSKQYYTNYIPKLPL